MAPQTNAMKRARYAYAIPSIPAAECGEYWPMALNCAYQVRDLVACSANQIRNVISSAATEQTNAVVFPIPKISWMPNNTKLPYLCSSHLPYPPSFVHFTLCTAGAEGIRISNFREERPLKYKAGIRLLTQISCVLLVHGSRIDACA